MSLDFEVWCPDKPQLPAIARVASLVMRAVLDVDGAEVTLREWGELSRFDWGSAAFVQADIQGPEYSEIPTWWTLWAEQGERGDNLQELLAIVVVASAGVVHGGIVVDETGRLPERKNDPFDLILSLMRSGARGHEALLRVLIAGFDERWM